jgi:hypothetical protein
VLGRLDDDAQFLAVLAVDERRYRLAVRVLGQADVVRVALPQ